KVLFFGNIHPYPLIGGYTLKSFSSENGKTRWLAEAQAHIAKGAGNSGIAQLVPFFFRKKCVWE
ncbi:hypothetical protein, partial [Turicimonas muris]